MDRASDKNFITYTNLWSEAGDFATFWFRGLGFFV